MTVRYDEISEILKVIDGSSCDEFVLETPDIKLVVRRRGAGGPAIEPSTSRPAASASAPAPTQATPKASAAPTAPAGAGAVTAPMVGTFYRSPSPGAPPFVEVGSKVKKGDPICIIEVMKLFTTIHAEWSGTIAEIGAPNAHLVEYGQMLFVITPD
jgi:acetyl-CoA carboxylase biotin carboxyl carrier protein